MGRKARPLQTTFTSGELDPKLRGRMDVTHYYNGADKLRNVKTFPQGGTIRRPGASFVNELSFVLVKEDLTGVTKTTPNGGAAANAVDGDTATELITTTNIGVIDPYVIIRFDFGSTKTIKFADVRGMRLAAGTIVSPDEVRFQSSPDDAVWTDFGVAIDFVGSRDRQRRRNNAGAAVAARYWRLVRIGTTDLTTDKFALDEVELWTETTTLSNARIPHFQFSDTQRYAFLLTDRNLRVYRDGVFQSDSFIPHTSAQLGAISWTGSLDTFFIFHATVQTHRVQRQGAHDEWDDLAVVFLNIPKEEFVVNNTTPAGTITPSATDGFITLTLSVAHWTAATDVGTFVTWNDGRARITGVDDTLIARAKVIVPPLDAAATSGWTHEEGWEASLSATRGWPQCGNIIAGGLWLGGSSSLPNAFWRSTLDDVFDLDLGQALADEGIFGTLDADDVPAIYAINGGRHVQFFTSSTEYFVLPEVEPITPTNIDPKTTTKVGMKGPGLPVVDVEGAVIFVQNSGSALRQFLFTDLEQAYEATNIALLSPHLISAPVDYSFRKAATSEEGNLIFVVNDDGTMGVLQTLRKQEITAWSLWETDGLYKAVGVDRNDIYAVVERVINGVTRRYFEKFEDRLFMDASVFYDTSSGLPATVLTGLAHLNGESAKIRADKLVLDPIVVAGGQVTIPDTANTSAEVGLGFPDVKQKEVNRLIADGASSSNAFREVYGKPDTVTGDGDEVWIKDMPVAVELSGQTAIGGKKRVSEVTAMVRSTSELFVGANGEPPIEVSLREFGDELLDQPLPQISDDIVVRGLLGSSKRGQVEILQRNPVPFTLLGIGKKVNM